MSPSSPRVFAEYEIIEEQRTALLDQVTQYSQEGCRIWSGTTCSDGNSAHHPGICEVGIGRRDSEWSCKACGCVEAGDGRNRS